MTYFDTDVLIHLLVPQDITKHKLARDAERHCDELYTFNKSDFRRIAQLSKLKVVVLE